MSTPALSEVERVSVIYPFVYPNIFPCYISCVHVILNESLLYLCVCVGLVIYVMHTCDTERVFVVSVCVSCYIYYAYL